MTEDRDVESPEVREEDDVVRAVVSVVVRRELCSTDCVDAIVITWGAKVIVVDKTVGIKAGLDWVEILVGTEDVLPCGVNVVFSK